ncbi:MAG: hemolysin family protein, partial [Planctomycetota bacterium]|nr:hemolysin family protein [Planctomycetota bacterium]
MEAFLPVGVALSLLTVSAFFAASEAALFSLGPEDQENAGPRAKQLLEHPRDLLVSVLLGNLVVNLVFFALVPRLAAGAGWSPLAAAAVALLAIVLCGEILPKTLGLRAPRAVARFTALPLAAVVQILAPARRAANAVIEVILRALGEAGKPEQGITTEALAEVLERSAGEDLLADEADLLAEIVELDSIRVREIMTPRVDITALDLAAEDASPAISQAIEERRSWLPVVDGGIDRVLGCVKVRDLLRWPERPVDQLVMPVKFVPEVASALDLLDTFREDRTSEAVVVDEWGGTAGIVTVEDVFEELVGDLRTEEEGRRPAVVPLGEGRFRVSGQLSIRDWNELFGRKLVPREFETVAGLVLALLGRMPRAGDRVSAGGLELVVNEMR